MKIQNNKNNQSFNGRVAIDGELSALPCKHVRRISSNLKTIMAEKPFDLFIKEDHKNDTILFIAQKTKDFGKTDKPKFQSTLSKDLNYYSEEAADDIYLATAKDAIDCYEEMNAKQQKTMFSKFKNVINKIFKK